MENEWFAEGLQWFSEQELLGMCRLELAAAYARGMHSALTPEERGRLELMCTVGDRGARLIFFGHADIPAGDGENGLEMAEHVVPGVRFIPDADRGCVYLVRGDDTAGTIDCRRDRAIGILRAA
jgi:hypothetical protein